MRGPLSGDRELLSFPAGENAAGNDNSCAPGVRADFDESFPIGAAELDAIEAYLMPQIKILLAGNCELPPQSGPKDSEVPQRVARNTAARKPVESRHEELGKRKSS